MSVSLSVYQKISLTPEPIWFFFKLQLRIYPLTIWRKGNTTLTKGPRKIDLRGIDTSLLLVFPVLCRIYSFCEQFLNNKIDNLRTAPFKNSHKYYRCNGILIIKELIAITYMDDSKVRVLILYSTYSLSFIDLLK